MRMAGKLLQRIYGSGTVMYVMVTLAMFSGTDSSVVIKALGY